MGSPGRRARRGRWGRRSLLRLGGALASGTLAVGTLAVVTTAPTAMAADDGRNWTAAAGDKGREGSRNDNSRVRARAQAATGAVTPYWVDTQRSRVRVARGGTIRVPFGANLSGGANDVTVRLETAGLDARQISVASVDAPCGRTGTKITCSFKNARAGRQTTYVTLRAAANARTGLAGWVLLTSSADGRGGWFPMFGRVDVVAAAAPPTGSGTAAPRPRQTANLSQTRPALAATASAPASAAQPGSPDGEGPDTDDGDTGATSTDDSTNRAGGTPTTPAVSAPATRPARTTAPTTSAAGGVLALPNNGAAAPELAELAVPRQVTNWPATFGAFGFLLVIVLTMIAVAGNNLGWFEESTAAHRA